MRDGWPDFNFFFFQEKYYIVLYSSLFSVTSSDNTLKSLRLQLKIYLSSVVEVVSYHPLLLIHEPQFNQPQLKTKITIVQTRN